MKRFRLQAGLGTLSAFLVALSAFPVQAHADDNTPQPTPAATADASQEAAAPGKATAEELQTMFDDMTKMNDVDLRRTAKDTAGRFVGPGYVMMGNDARGTSAPKYWSDKLVDRTYASAAYWEAINPWFYITTGKNNASTNTRVEISQIKLNILRRSTNQWETVQIESVGGSFYGTDLAGKPVDKAPDIRNGKNGSVEILQNLDQNLVFHGWGKEMNYNTKDILAVHTQVQARLVVNDSSKPDDRAKAQQLIQVGTDYYPHLGTRVEDQKMRMRDDEGKKEVDGYFPGVGLSRAKLVTNEWQTFNFVNVNAPGVKHEGTGGANVSITADQLRNNPPPSWLPGEPAKK